MLSIVQTAQNSTTTLLSTTVAVTLGNVRAGNLLVVCYNGGVHQVTGISDGTNTFVAADTGGFSWSDCEIWYAKNIAGLTAPTVAATASLAQAATIQVYEIQGADPDNPLDVHGDANGDGTTSNVPTMTSAGTGNSFEILVASCSFFSGSGTNLPTVGAGYTNFLVTNSTPTTGANISAGAETQIVGGGTHAVAFGLASATTTWELTYAVFKGAANEPGNIGRYVRAGDGMGRSEVAN